MKMHEHDQEIIMALAEGSLDPAAADAAEAAIAACAECTADLELQRFALSSLDEIDTPYLTATESADLHRTLRRELSLERPQPKQKRKGFAWGRWVPAVGLAAVFLAAVAALPSMLGGSDDDSADMTMAAEATTAAPETTAAASMDEGVYELDVAAGEAAPQFDDAAGADGGTAADRAEEAPAETTAAPETTAAAAEATTTTFFDHGIAIDELSYLGPIDELDTDALLARILAAWEESGDRVNTGKMADPAFSDCLLETASPEVAPEYGIAPNSLPLVQGLVSNGSGEQLVLVAYVPEDIEQTVFIAHRSWVCEVAAVVAGD